MLYLHKSSRDSKIVESTIFSSNHNAVKRNVFIKSFNSAHLAVVHTYDIRHRHCYIFSVAE